MLLAYSVTVYLPAGVIPLAVLLFLTVLTAYKVARAAVKSINPISWFS